MSAARRFRTWEAGGRLVEPVTGLRWYVLDGGAASEQVAAQLNTGEWVNPMAAHLRAIDSTLTDPDTAEHRATITRGLAWV